MNAPSKQLMLLDGMAAKYGLAPQEFSATVRATCGMPNASAEEFAAFVSVCKEYGLNPLLREIYAFPKRGGGLIPVVSIDGWIHLINEHPMADGFEFDVHEPDGELIAITCRMHRKDRSHPVEVTEYLSECIRATEPWKMRHRMLRHKALIQAARYAYGFSGIYDEDEARGFADIKDVTPPAPPKPSAGGLKNTQFAEIAKKNSPPVPPKPPVKSVDVQLHDLGTPDEIVDADTGEIQTPGELLSDLDDALATAKSDEEIEIIYNDYDLEARLAEMPKGEEFVGVAIGIRRRHAKRVANEQK